MATYTNIDTLPVTPPRVAPRLSRRARARALVALVVALGAGLLATWLITRALKHRPTEMVSVPVRKVVVARQELPLATTLREDNLKVIEWPAPSVPEGTVEDPQKVVGRVLKTAVVPGDAIVEARLAPTEGGAGLAAMIPPNMRAMTVKVNEASGVAGFIHPGDLVDVIATMPPDDRTTVPRSRIVLQNIRVLAVGQEMQPGGAKPIQVPVVTLLVGPAESERLALASSRGELQLTMRSGVDTGEVPTPGISPTELYADANTEPESPRLAAVGEQSPTREPARRRHGSSRVGPTVMAPPPPAAPPPDNVVEIIRGTSSEQRRLRSPEPGKVEVRR